jgi:uncharacterized protein (DUF433 family)
MLVLLSMDVDYTPPPRRRKGCRRLTPQAPGGNVALAADNPRLAPGVGSLEESDMTRDELLSRISIDPNVCFGKPCIRGHRIWVSLILDFLASGMTPQEILGQYPGLEEADIRACIAYGAEMSRERFVEIPAEPKP